MTRLQEVIAVLEDDGGDGYQAIEAVLPDAQQWLTWTYNFLSARKEYHRKARIKSAMLERMAKTLLSKDELDMIDREAESQLASPVTEEEPETEEEGMPE